MRRLRTESNMAREVYLSPPVLLLEKKTMLHFNSCQKCLVGTIYEHDGFDGLEKKCVNCGYIDYEVSSELTSLKTSSDAAAPDAAA